VNVIAETPVLIVGGGPVGLGLSLSLSQLGTPNILVEKDGGTALVMLTKGGGHNERSMEFFRRWGVRNEVVAKAMPEDYPRRTVFCTALNGHELGNSPEPPWRENSYSPERRHKIPAYLFDPILARAALATKLSDIRYNSRFEQLVQDDKGVTAELTNTVSGEPFAIRAQYIVACDGSASNVRTSLGIPFPGKDLGYSLSAMLRIDELERHHSLGKTERFLFVGTNGSWASMSAADGRGLWRFNLLYSKEKYDLDNIDIQTYLKRAFGKQIPYEFIRMAPWKRSQCCADRLRAGRVFLAGDAAHTTSPTGGLGGNTGLGDAIGLSWILDAVVRGWGSPGLLDAYEVERRPIAVRNSTMSTRNFKGWMSGGTGTDFSKVLDETSEGEAARKKAGREMAAMLYPEWYNVGIALGYRYEGSPIIVPDGTNEPPDDPSEYIPTSRPGHRAPHAWLADGRSTLDLFGRGFVLLRFGGSPPDVTPLLAGTSRRNVPLSVVDIESSDIMKLYERRLVLVRPDGHAAWRGNELPPNIDDLVETIRGGKARSSATVNGGSYKRKAVAV